MKTILVAGAGRSSHSLIRYLLSHCERHNWKVIIGDVMLAAAERALNGSPQGTAIAFDLNNKDAAAEVIKSADVVISLLPPHFHVPLARLCLDHRKHLLTASYISSDMLELDNAAKQHDLLFLNECGLDPGIDHMSAMQVIEDIKSKGGKMISFESFTGGLIAPDTDPQNPWRYKFTWNPLNVVMAGQGGAEYLSDGKKINVSYNKLFTDITSVTVPGSGAFEGYANRDSLKYMETYGLRDIRTMIRGTLRSKGFCSAWNVLVQLGCTDNTFEMRNVETMTHHGYLESFIRPGDETTLQQKLIRQLGVGDNDLRTLQWSGLFDKELVGLTHGSPAQILEHILQKKWKLNAGDKDMIVMWHRFIYERDQKRHTLQSSLVVIGEDEHNTAMAKTVGLPLAIAAKLLLEGKIHERGVCIPVKREFYEPILKELEELGVKFKELFS